MTEPSCELKTNLSNRYPEPDLWHGLLRLKRFPFETQPTIAI